MKIVLLVLILVIILVGGVFYFGNSTAPLLVPTLVKRTVSGDVNYKGVGRLQPDVAIFDNNTEQVTQIEITADGELMLVGTLTGTILVYQKTDGEFKRQSEPLFILETSQPGFPPEEAGLTGIILGPNLKDRGDVFLAYSFREGKKDYRNRITRITMTRDGEKIVGRDPVLIFEANTAGGPSHQIQDGISFKASDETYLLFSIGEGFEAAKALEPTLEAGKLMLIDRNGKAPEGVARFPNPKIQAIGIRNAPAIATSRKLGLTAMVDTGPDNLDRLLVPQVFDSENKELSFNWDGSEESLSMPAPNPMTGADMVVYRWSPSETPVNVLFYENSKLPELSQIEDYALVTLFGRTGEQGKGRGRKIVLGRLTNSRQPRITFEDFIERTEAGVDQMGNPLGLAVDPIEKTIYFGDILEGKIYQADIR